MLEYVFFDESILNNFVMFARARGIDARQSPGEDLIVEIPEDLDPSLEQEIDMQYEHLLQETASLLEQGSDALEKNVAGYRLLSPMGDAVQYALIPILWHVFLPQSVWRNCGIWFSMLPMGWKIPMIGPSAMADELQALR